MSDEELRGLDVPPEVLAVDPEEFRRLGYWLVDRTVAHLHTVDDAPVISVASPDELEHRLGGPVPVEAHPMDADLRLLAEVALANEQHGDHRRYFARVPSPSSPPAILGEWLGTGLLSVASSWAGGSGPTAVELIACGWLRDALGLPAGSEGILLSGGSMANLTGMLVARHLRGPGIVYCSDQTHSSLTRGLRQMGVAETDLRILPTDAHFRLDPQTLRAAVESDLADGRQPLMAVATAGTTNTGAVDDLPAIADLCTEFGIWLHVDGAYGGPAVIADPTLIPGLDRVDSFVTDPHKWLFQPYGIAALFVREPGALDRTFTVHPEYLADLDGDEVDFHNRSLELSRPSRALRLWLTFRAYGLPRISQAISRGIALAEYAEQQVAHRPEFEIITPARLGILTFAVRGVDAAEHHRIVAEVTAGGVTALSTTVLAGRTVLRLCIINPRTTTEDLDLVLDQLSGALRA